MDKQVYGFNNAEILAILGLGKGNLNVFLDFLVTYSTCINQICTTLANQTFCYYFPEDLHFKIEVKGNLHRRCIIKKNWRLWYLLIYILSDISLFILMFLLSKISASFAFYLNVKWFHLPNYVINNHDTLFWVLLYFWSFLDLAVREIITIYSLFENP